MNIFNHHEVTYPIINQNYTISTRDGFVLLSGYGKDYRISPLLGLVLSYLSGNKSFDEIFILIHEITGIDKEKFDTLLEKINSVIPDLIIFSNEKLTVYDEYGGEREQIINAKPIYFDMLHACRLTGPKVISFNVTNECDFNCIYCHNRLNKLDKSILSIPMDKIKPFFISAKHKGLEKVIITGGDPIKYHNIHELISFLSTIEIHTMLSTKTLPDEELMEKLNKDGLCELQYSLDTENPILYNVLTGKKLNKDVLSEALTSMCKSRIDCYVKCVISSVNIDSIPVLMDYLLANSFYKISFNIFSPVSNEQNYLIVPENKLNNLYKIMQKYVSLGMQIDFSYPKKKHICGSLIHTLYLNYDGNVSFCFKDFNNSQLNLGNIQINTLDEIWNSPKAQSLITPKKSEFNDKCRDCLKFEKCIYYGCLYERIRHGGSIYSEEEKCIINEQ